MTIFDCYPRGTFSLAVLVITLLSATIAPAHASVVISGTRVIYPANEREVTVRFENKNQKPALVQVWLDSGDENLAPERAKVPFIATPPIFRLEPGKQHALRLAYTGEQQPEAIESLYWLNMLEVPPKALGAQNANQLQFAFRTRIKVFFRPDGLPYGPEQAAEKLRWKLVSDVQGTALEVQNPTPYYLSFESVEVLAGGQRHGKPTGQASSDNMVAPNASNRFALPSLKTLPAVQAQVEFESIDDHGGRIKHISPVTR